MKQLNSFKEKGNWEFIINIDESLFEADAIVILTEWDQYKIIDWANVAKIMRKPSWIFDTRSCIDYKKAIKAGFNIWQVGNSSRIKK